MLFLRFLFSAALWGSHDASATPGGAAVAHVELLHRLAAGTLVLVIVGKLYAGLNVLQRIDPDALVLDDRLAVWITGVIYQPGRVGTHSAVDTGLVIEREEKSVVARHLLFVVPAVRFLVRNSWSCVLDDLLAWPDPPRREKPSTLNCRSAYLIEAVSALSAAFSAVLLHYFSCCREPRIPRMSSRRGDAGICL